MVLETMLRKVTHIKPKLNEFIKASRFNGTSLVFTSDLKIKGLQHLRLRT